LFDVANPNQTLMTQMTAQVFFVAASAKDAVLVPLAALRPVAPEVRAGVARTGSDRASGIDPRSQFANGIALVAVVGADGKAVDREVKVGVMNRVSAQILSGLDSGEKVVIGTKAPVAAAQTQTGNALVPTNAPKGGGRP